MQRRNLPQGPRPAIDNPTSTSDDSDPYPLPSLKEYLNAGPVQYKPRTKAQGILDFLHTIFWISLALVVLYAGDGDRSLLSILQYDQKVNR